MLLRVADLHVFYANPRRGRVDVIAESLSELGQYRPIVVNEGTMTGRPFEVLAGNHTLLAARELGWTEIDAFMVDVDDDDAAKIVTVDNRSNDLAQYDEAALAELLALLPDLRGTGWTDEQVATLRGELPDFAPADDDDARLDRLSVCECPNCKFIFTPKTFSMIDDDGELKSTKDVAREARERRDEPDESASA